MPTSYTTVKLAVALSIVICYAEKERQFSKPLNKQDDGRHTEPFQCHNQIFVVGVLPSLFGGRWPVCGRLVSAQSLDGAARL